jgi:nitrogen regulatory protein PII-like uncharacterized protein
LEGVAAAWEAEDVTGWFLRKKRSLNGWKGTNQIGANLHENVRKAYRLSAYKAIVIVCIQDGAQAMRVAGNAPSHHSSRKFV